MKRQPKIKDDIIKSYGLDITESLTNILSEELSKEIDKEILRSLGIEHRRIRRKDKINKIISSE